MLVKIVILVFFHIWLGPTSTDYLFSGYIGYHEAYFT